MRLLDAVLLKDRALIPPARRLRLPHAPRGCKRLVCSSPCPRRKRRQALQYTTTHRVQSLKLSFLDRREFRCKERIKLCIESGDVTAVAVPVNQVRVWELQRGYGTQPVTAVPKAQINHDAPVLCTDFSSDGSKVFSGGASKQARLTMFLMALCQPAHRTFNLHCKEVITILSSRVSHGLFSKNNMLGGGGGALPCPPRPIILRAPWLVLSSPAELQAWTTRPVSLLPACDACFLRKSVFGEFWGCVLNPSRFTSMLCNGCKRPSIPHSQPHVGAQLVLCSEPFPIACGAPR